MYSLRMLHTMYDPDYQHPDENIRKCLVISYRLGEIGNGGNYSVASVLEDEDFKCLSENQKAQVFSHKHYIPDIEPEAPSEKTCLHKVADHDIPTYLQQMLPYMPLHKFQSCSLSPGGFTWVESEEWMRDVLSKHKIRWDPDSNPSYNKSISQKASDKDDDAAVNDGEDVMLINSSLTDDDTIQKLRNLAFTMLAAELFYICCRCNAIRCCRYLLSIAPNLVEIRAGKNKTVALCTALVYDSSEVIDLLLEQQAPICNLGEATHQVFCISNSTRSFEIIKNILHRSENRENVRLFQDQDGNTILHLLMEPLLMRNLRMNTNMVTSTKYVESCIQMILAYGGDPHKRNDKNETVLDVLIMWYVFISKNFISIHPRSANIPNITEVFLRNLELILPSWGVVLPSGFSSKHKTVSEGNVMLCKIAELLLTDEHSLTFAIRSMQSKKLFGGCAPTDCQLCLPAVSLFYKAMLKGIDMHSIPGEPIPTYVPKSDRCQDYVNYLLRVSSLPGWSSWNGKSDQKCCEWALLELLVHSGNDVFSYMDMRRHPQDVMCYHVDGLCEILTGLVTKWFDKGSEFYLDHITNIMSMLSMYAPSMLQRVLPRLLAYCTSLPNNDKKMEALLEAIARYQKKLACVRPLQLLCRITVRGNVAFQDVEKLPLPGHLKHYVRIGDISQSHVIHQIIEKLEEAK